MKNKILFIFQMMTFTAKSGVQSQYGASFFREFRSKAKQYLESFLPKVPDIGNSIFALNYNYGPIYFAWYSALLDLNVDKKSALDMIWQINEDFVKAFPPFLLRWFAKNMYLGEFRNKGITANQKSKTNELHPFDWRVEYIDIDQNTFAINIYECAMLKLADLFGYQEMFPHICRMDYLFSHYFHNSFKRTMTLADGDICCNCWYQFPGQCEWAPDKGFENRK